MWMAAETSKGQRKSFDGISLPSIVALASDVGKKEAEAKGRRTRINQDTAVVSQLGEDLCVLAVYDGHGEYGDVCSRAAAKGIFNILNSDVEGVRKAPSAALARALPVVDQSMPVEKSSHSGTTAIIAILQPRRVTGGVWDGMRCVGMRCDGMRCGGMRCGGVTGMSGRNLKPNQHFRTYWALQYG